MYNIKLFNNISNNIYNELDERFNVSTDLEDYDAVIVRSADMHEVDLPNNAVAVARAGAGYNNIPVDKYSEKGVVVFNTPGANANAVKELVLCAILLSGRDIIGGIEWVNEQGRMGTQNVEKLAEKIKNQYVGNEVAGKTLGVIGLGAIGVLVANAACNGLGMKVIGYDPFMSVEAAWNLTRAVEHTDNINELFEKCDYITLHLPLNDNTKNIVSARMLSKMKDGSVILNFARGGLVNSKDIHDALESGKVAKYITDFATDDLIGQKGVIAIPHLGASTPESEDNCAEMAAKQIKDYVVNGNIVNSVNYPACNLPRTGKYRISINHRNIMNMVGQITAILAARDINIDHMVNTSRGDWAYTLIELSNGISDDVEESLKAIDGVVRVRRLYED